ncbi:MAG: dihydroorotate dehydrogenase electron transfer subunit [Desulfobacteraceae bacterium]|nr:MAG: dihydroorotate dehydrogenase electron transfer subunit [Desulfobacteraceae bacterium]
MITEKVRILWNKHVGSSYYKIGLKCGYELIAAKPGQFVMLRFEERTLPLLRRPFSIHGIIEGEGVEILYRVVGGFTGRLSEVKDGEWIDIMGPLGKGFFPPENSGGIFIVAGGIGVAPMLFLSKYILEKKMASSSGMRVFLGAGSKEDLLCRDDFSRLGLEVVVTTDDGSDGEACLITNPVEAAVREKRPGIIYACGPPGMLKCLAGIAEKYEVPSQISMESVMACGIGACLGCAVEGKDESRYLHVCVDGPVFDSRDIKF